MTQPRDDHGDPLGILKPIERVGPRYGSEDALTRTESKQPVAGAPEWVISGFVWEMIITDELWAAFIPNDYRRSVSAPLHPALLNLARTVANEEAFTRGVRCKVMTHVSVTPLDTGGYRLHAMGDAFEAGWATEFRRRADAVMENARRATAEAAERVTLAEKHQALSIARTVSAEGALVNEEMLHTALRKEYASLSEAYTLRNMQVNLARVLVAGLLCSNVLVYFIH